MKRVVVIADLHCGHAAGLVPPAYRSQMFGDRIFALQSALWDEYARIIKSLQPIHLLIANGDLIDGKGIRSGGTELITTDRVKQCKMAIESIELAEADNVRIIRGTPYHAGVEEDWEDLIAKEVGAKIGDHEWFDVDGVVFDCKHKISASSIPHGRGTPLAKEWLWNTIWHNEREQQPLANVYIRSHVHYYYDCGSVDWRAISTPALQAAATKFGAKLCSGTVHWGLVWFDIEDGRFEWHWHTQVVEEQKVKAEVI